MQLATIRSILKAIKKAGHRTTYLLLYITNDYELDIIYKLYYTKHIRSLARVGLLMTQGLIAPTTKSFFIAIKFSK